MKSFKSLMESLAEAWPGTPEYKKKFGSPSDDGSEGSRHKIDRSAGITRATRKYDAESGESEEPTKNREDAAAAPVKRGRGRPPGKYGSYKKKVKESIEILEALETDEEIEEFVFSLDEESFAELEQYLSLDEEQLDEIKLQTAASAYKKMAAGGNDMKNRTGLAGDQSDRLLARMKKKFGEKETEKAVREEVKQTDEAMSHQAKTTMKHVKDATPGEKKAAKDIKPGIAGYRDRVAMLKSAEARGGLKEDEVAEALKHPNHKVLDKNKNNKLDREDFAILRGEKKAPVKEEIGLAEGSGPKEKQHDKYVDRNSPAAQAKVQAAKDSMAAEKKAEAGKKLLAKIKEEVSEEKVADIAAFITKQAKGEA